LQHFCALRVLFTSTQFYLRAFLQEDRAMLERSISLPIVGMIAGTRFALGVGLGLLVADRLASDRRHAAGWALLAVGALTTIPLVVEVLRGDAEPPVEPAETPLRRHGLNRLFSG
jgi:hypothetical protein